MLNIYFGDMPEAVYNTSVYFNYTYEDEWLTSDFAKEVIKTRGGRCGRLTARGLAAPCHREHRIRHGKARTCAATTTEHQPWRLNKTGDKT